MTEEIRDKWQIDYMAWRPGELNSRDGSYITGKSEEDVLTNFDSVKRNLALPPRYEVYSAVLIRPDGTRKWLVGG